MTKITYSGTDNRLIPGCAGVGRACAERRIRWPDDEPLVATDVRILADAIGREPTADDLAAFEDAFRSWVE